MVRYSDDGGHTWSAEMHFSLGVEGDYGKRIILEQQGAAEHRIYDLAMTDNRSFTIISGHANIKVGI
jgi:hypothetical protein